MKKSGVLVIGALVFSLLIVPMLILKLGSITGKVVYEIPVGLNSENCNSATASQIWDSIFKESSSGITTRANSSGFVYCVIESYKLAGNRLYYLGVLNMSFFGSNMLTINSKVKNCTPDCIANVSSGNISEIITNPDLSKYTYKRNITSANEANGNFSALFKIIPSLSFNVSSTFEYPTSSYFFLENQTIGNTTIVYFGAVNANYSDDSFLFLSNSLDLSCMPNWVLSYTPCQSNERQTKYYVDWNGCGNSSTVPSQNYTATCDFNGDGFIGSLSNLTSRANFNISLTLVNLSAANDTKRVGFMEGNKTFVEFDWNFSSAPLDLINISVKKQINGSGFGYTIVNGVNVSKTVYVDIVNGAYDKVCVKDEDVDSSDQISVLCNASRETILTCPASVSGFSCSITNGRFRITGLRHSGVREITSVPSTNCTPNWNCTSWNVCANNVQTRMCNDSNRCNTAAGKPNESNSCVITIPPLVCTPNWNCTNWSVCKANVNQTRTCTDLNTCNADTGKPVLMQKCEVAKTGGISTSTLIILIITILIILIGLIIVFLLIGRKEETERILNPAEYTPISSQTPFGGGASQAFDL